MIVAELIPESQEVLGTSDLPTIYRKLTAAVRLLAQKADWDPLIGYVDICAGTDRHTITLPRDVETPIAVSAGGNPLQMRSKWAEFHSNGGGMQGETAWNWDDTGFFPVIQDLNSPSRLVAVAQLQNDLGTPLRVFGLDQNGRIVRTQAPDGTWQDGALIAANVISDFSNGIIMPDDTRYFYRLFQKTATTLFHSPAHGFVTGSEVVLTLVTGPLPSPLIGGVSYFAGVVDADNLQLFGTLQGALTNINPIVLTNATSSSLVNLNDLRQIQARTKFTSATDLTFQQAMQVTFTGAPLPDPITPGELFFINLIDLRNFTIHATADDANAGTNPLFVESAGTNVVAEGLQPATPYTQFNFTANHDFLQGDAVTVSNAGGNLPTPLLPGTTYYVRYLTNRSITLHLSLADATSAQNAIILTDAGTGVTSIVKLIQASVTPGSLNNITAANHNLGTGDFVQFQSSGTLPTPIQQNTVYVVGAPSSANTFTLSNTSASSTSTATRRRASNISVITTQTPHGLLTSDIVNVQSMGDPTYNAQQVTVTRLDNNSFSYPNSGANEDAIATVSRCRTNNISIVQTATAHGLTTGDFVYISGLGGGFSYNGWFQTTVIDATHFYFTNIGGNEGGAPTATRARTSNVATVTTGLVHGFSTGQIVNIQGMGSGYDAYGVTVTVTSTTAFTYANTGANESSTPDTSGYAAAGVPDTNGLVAVGVTDTGGVILYGQVNITDTGTGVLYLVISRAFSVGFTNGWFTDTTSLSDGTAVQLTTTGSLPISVPQITPLVNYYTRDIDDFTAYLYTSQAKALDAAARMTATRSRTTNVATVVTTAPHGFTTNDYITLAGLGGTGYNGTFSVTVVDPVTFTYIDAGTDEATTADVGGLATFAPIQITGLGSGNYFFALSAPVTTAFLTNGMDIASALYFNNGTPVTLTTDGTLPSPLQPATTYLASLDANALLTFTLTDGTPITLTALGNGNHYLNHQEDFSIQIPTEIQVAANEYQTGDAVTFNTSGTAATPLVPGTVYFVRRTGNDTVELYDTAAHALDLANTTGIQMLLGAGTGDQRLEQSLEALQFLKITRIQLDQRSGFVDLWAWDYNRRSDLTLVGSYHPTETNPQYRRIKTLASCCWIRMRYKRRTFDITSDQDYIPLDSTSAITAMLKSKDMYDKNFFDEGDRFETLAVKWCKEDHDSKRGPEAIQIQIGPGGGDQAQDCENEWMT